MLSNSHYHKCSTVFIKQRQGFWKHYYTVQQTNNQPLLSLANIGPLRDLDLIGDRLIGIENLLR